MKKQKIILSFLCAVLVGSIMAFPLLISKVIQQDEKPVLTAQNTVVQYDRVEIPAKLTDRKEQIIEHCGYMVSYNSEWKIPNWVAYELTKEEVEGVTPRGKDFVPDPEVKGATATTEDYKNSGWDRGHLAPAADMKWSKQAMTESFYLSNICPQNHNLNGGVWKDLEERVRSYALQHGRLYVVCGPIVDTSYSTIGENKVAVPSAFFKVLLQNTQNQWSAIAFVFPNQSGRKPLSSYTLTVNELQKITHIDFFPTLPDSIENAIENTIDLDKWEFFLN
ncbi:MAG: DNA/RNA non-specific endonuclease [Bacteroidales bacterium]|jgi:endonuclease G|nr:DNA/RNA non-specific endonuclease [Bacteroidales bacterium]